jgi:hypothetical protein
MRPLALLLFALLALTACSESLPDDVPGYRERCLLMNRAPIPPTASDPHEGVKNVFACGVTEDQLIEADGKLLLPYPEGTLIVKESVKPEQGYVWLIATARKQDGQWAWDEYKRNFDNEGFLRILASESVCVDCHRQVEGQDWMFTTYQPR